MQNPAALATPHLALDVVDHDALLLDQNCHVSEHLAKLNKALVELLHSFMPLIDLVQSVQ